MSGEIAQAPVTVDPPGEYVTNPKTGRKENPELRARYPARQLEEKKNLTLAEKLILASNKRKMSVDVEGVEIEIRVPNEEEFTRLAHLNDTLLQQTSDTPDADRAELCGLVSSLCIDDSLTPEIFLSGALGIMFIPCLIAEIVMHEKEHIEQIQKFRKK